MQGRVPRYPSPQLPVQWGDMSPIAWTLKHAKRIVIVVVGVTVLGLGIVMTVMPGPAIIVIPLGLGILSTEFIWARKLLHRIKERLPPRVKDKAP